MSAYGRDAKEYVEEKVRTGQISKEDGDIVLDIILADAGEKGWAVYTTAMILRYVVASIEVLPDVRSWTTEMISQRAIKIRAKYKPNPARKYINYMKMFAHRIADEGINTKIDLAKIDKIKVPPADHLTKTAGQMITESQVLDLIRAGKCSRDRAILALSYESGMRPVEVLALKWGDVKFDEYGAVINTDGKTGKARYIRLIAAAPYLSAWKSDCPAPDSHMHIFTNLREPHEVIGHSNLKKIVGTAAVRAGIDKRVYPYLLRHCRVSHMLEQEIPESVIKLQHWGSLSTPMLATYGHVTNKAIDDALLSRAGIVRKKERAETKFKPGICPVCNAICKVTAKFCENCGNAMTEEAALSIERRENRMLERIMERLNTKQQSNQ